MRVKRYVVDSMPDALQRIRVDLGKDAVILNTKEIKSGGFLGFFSKKKIEVIAATDNANNPPKQTPPIHASAQNLESPSMLSNAKSSQEARASSAVSVQEQPI